MIHMTYPYSHDSEKYRTSLDNEEPRIAISEVRDALGHKFFSMFKHISLALYESFVYA